jgi:hypothetical protein
MDRPMSMSMRPWFGTCCGERRSVTRIRSDDDQSCTAVAQRFPVLLGEEPGLRNRLTGLVVMWA